MRKILLVAETNEDGDVVCVWRKMPGQKGAKPILKTMRVYEDLSGAEVFGAPRTAVLNWLEPLPAT